MTAADKLDRILEAMKIPLDGTVTVDGHTYRAWAGGKAPYEFIEITEAGPLKGQRRLTIDHPNGDRYAAIGKTNPDAVDAMAKRLGVTFTEEPVHAE